MAFDGAPTRAEMLVCTTAGVTFALMYLDLTDPASTTPALAALRQAAQSNIGGVVTANVPARVPGMTPNPEATRSEMVGRLPDGTAVQEQALFFVKGLRIYQASIIGARVAPDVAGTFFGGLRFPG